MKRAARKPPVRPAPAPAPACPPRTHALAAVVVLLALLSLAGFRQFMYSPERDDPYAVAGQMQRFLPLLPLIPPQATVGYVTDVPDSNTLATVVFLVAQNALAPRLLVDLPKAPPAAPVIGNFSVPQDYAAFGRRFGLAMVRDFGNGVVLYRREAR